MRLRLLAAIIFACLPLPALATLIFSGNGTIQGNLCVGLACFASESQGSDTLRLKSTSVQLHFEDTSTSSLSDLDWRIRVNDSASEFFAISQAVPNRTPFRINGGAPTNALFVSGSGNLGLGTSNPQQTLHLLRGDSPVLRLEQDGSAGFDPRTWDVGGNEINFFVRDPVADLLSFRIMRGAPSNALVVSGTGNTGIGVAFPSAPLHIVRDQSNNVPHVLVETQRSNGRAEIWFADGRTDTDNDALRLQLKGDAFNITFNGTGGAELAISKAGDVTVPRGDLLVPNGGVVVGGQGLNVPDYVFAPDYALMPLSDMAAFIAEHSHLPHIPSATDVKAHGLDVVDMQLALLRTVEEQALYILELRAAIDALNARLD